MGTHLASFDHNRRQRYGFGMASFLAVSRGICVVGITWPARLYYKAIWEVCGQMDNSITECNPRFNWHILLKIWQNVGFHQIEGLYRN